MEKSYGLYSEDSRGVCFAEEDEEVCGDGDGEVGGRLAFRPAALDELLARRRHGRRIRLATPLAVEFIDDALRF